MSVLVLPMLKYLTKRCNIWQLHSLDEDLIKVSVSALLSHGETIDSDEAASWLLANGWDETAVSNFQLILEIIAEGKKVKINDITSAPTEKSMLELFHDMDKHDTDSMSV